MDKRIPPWAIRFMTIGILELKYLSVDSNHYIDIVFSQYLFNQAKTKIWM